MKFGLTEDQYNYLLKNVITPLRSKHCELYCYGSRARGDYNKFSDLDLMIESEQDQASTVALIKEKLTKSNFPYKVDLVQLKDFAESYLASYKKDKIKF